MTYKTKKEITEKILLELKDDPDNPWKNLTPDKVIFQWWMTGRSGFGLRLTETGHKALSYAKIEYYEFPFDMEKEKSLVKSWDQYIKQVSKKVDCPYFIGVKDKIPFIRIYDHRIAMMMTLYGSLGEYLDSVIKYK
jgi:hypothetical protein